MAEAFKYLSPREFHKLSAAAKERYLTALFEHLHPERKPLQKGADVTRNATDVGATDRKD